MKKLITLLATTLALSAYALPKAEDLWVSAATAADGTDYSVLKGSAGVTKNDNGLPVVAVRGRIVKSNGDITPQMWYVPLDDCLRGQGTFVIMDANGAYQGNSQFAFSGGTIGSMIAEVLCTVAEKIMNETPSQQKQPTKKSNGPST
jgi:hypothetical protein